MDYRVSLARDRGQLDDGNDIALCHYSKRYDDVLEKALKRELPLLTGMPAQMALPILRNGLSDLIVYRKDFEKFTVGMEDVDCEVATSLIRQIIEGCRAYRVLLLFITPVE